MSTVIPAESDSSISLKCGNVRTAFLGITLICWIFILILICTMASYSGNPVIATHARAINNFFGNSAAIITAPVVLLATFFYFTRERKMLTWDNGLLIDGKPAAIVNYQFKKFSPGINLIYLKSAGRLWIVYPVTSQDNMRHKNARLLQEETAYNETHVELLKGKLIASGAIEKRFWFLTKTWLYQSSFSHSL